MNLVKQLPIGLGFACLMMMSSCSNEDVLAPEPVKNEKTDASMRGIPPILTAIPHIAPTYGPAGSNVYPAGWQRSNSTSNDLVGLPTGTSTLTHLFGNEGLPWQKPLPPIPNAPNANSFLTISSNSKKGVFFSDDAALANKRSSVETKVKNLKPGKMYEITYYVASTICKLKQNNYTPTLPWLIRLDWIGANGQTNALTVNADTEAVWFPYTITFEAVTNEQILNFTAFTDSDSKFTYAHIFVDQNSIKEVQLAPSGF